jgi:hypothetical protein
MTAFTVADGGLVVPLGWVDVRVDKSATRRFVQGQRVLAGSEIVDCAPETAELIGFKRPQPKRTAVAEPMGGDES